MSGSGQSAQVDFVAERERRSFRRSFNRQPRLGLAAPLNRLAPLPVIRSRTSAAPPDSPLLSSMAQYFWRRRASKHIPGSRA